ncbi:hypothetical protein D3OALGA1CA_1691 [Olavius algarvensis associated proteobacterium Delta 3]|nr:hypothetical protein D3OALGA1CA_1691 [Olavius algarvensis associated proteobacterium Delta 3]
MLDHLGFRKMKSKGVLKCRPPTRQVSISQLKCSMVWISRIQYF